MTRRPPRDDPHPPASSPREDVASIDGERTLRELVETTQDGVVFIDEDAHVVLLNAAAEQMFEYDASEVLGKKVNVLMGKPYSDEHDRYIRHYEETGEKRAIGRIRTVLGRRKSGEEFPLQLSVTRLGGRGRTRYAAFLRDISRTVALQEQLVERERLAAMGSAAAMLAHEIANPLNGIYLEAQVLDRAFSKDEGLSSRFGEDVHTIINEVQRLRRLLDDFRQVSRRGQADYEPLSLAPLVHGVVRLVALQATDHAIDVHVDVPLDLPPVVGSVDRIKQALLNVCKNAVEAMPNGGTLRIDVQPRSDAVVVRIADTGVGIPEGVDVFEPFKTTKRDGTGLGLSVVKQIMASHGGSVEVEAGHEPGTTFNLVFPHVPGREQKTA